MEYLTLVMTITFAHLLAVISPGPDFIMCVRNSIIYSRKAGICTAIGFGCGIAVHILYSLVGLALIISKSILLFNFIKLLGASYLIYIGIKSVSSKSSKIEISKQNRKNDISMFSAFRMGFLTNVLNPKAALFFLGLFTIAISPQTPSYILTILSIIMIVNTILWFSLIATLITRKKARLIFENFQEAFNKIFGVFLIILGVKIILSKK